MITSRQIYTNEREPTPLMPQRTQQVEAKPEEQTPAKLAKIVKIESFSNMPIVKFVAVDVETGGVIKSRTLRGATLKSKEIYAEYEVRQAAYEAGYQIENEKDDEK